MQIEAHHTILDAAALGREVENAYDLARPVRCALFNSGVNEIYFVQAGDAQYMLRIARLRRFGDYHPEDYLFELELLEFLYSGGLPVCRPLRRRDGGWLGWLDAPEGQRAWSLFDYVPGKPPKQLDVDLSGQAGKLLGRLHQRMDEFQPRQPRFTLGETFLIREPLNRLRQFPGLAASDLALLEHTGARLQAWLVQQEHNPQSYGIVHGDFWWSNLHYTPARLALIDFDFCGYGWRMYDLSALLVTAKILHYKLDENAFLAGYQSVRPLAPAELASLPYFEQIRLLWVFGLWTSFENLRGTRWFYDVFSPAFEEFKRLLAEQNESGSG